MTAGTSHLGFCDDTNYALFTLTNDNTWRDEACTAYGDDTICERSDTLCTFKECREFFCMESANSSCEFNTEFTSATLK